MRRPAHLAVACVLLAVVALIGVELGRGALGDGALALPDPCTRQVAVAGEGVDPQTQRIALTALDAAACELGTSREELLLDVTAAATDGDELPDEVTARLRAGLLAAIDAEEDAGNIGGTTAWVLRQAARFTPLDWLLRAIRELDPLLGG